MSSRCFYAIIIGFLAGVGVRSFIDLGVFGVVAVAVISCALAFLYHTRSGKAFLVSTIVLLAFAVGLMRFDLADRAVGDPRLFASIGEEVEMEGVVTNEVISKSKYQRVIVSVDHLATASSQSGVDSKVLVYAPHYPHVAYGDRISISGAVTAPENFQTDVGREFTYVGFLKKDGIFFQSFYPDVVVLSDGHGGFLKRTLLSTKQMFLQSISSVMPDPHAALMGGITVGAEEALGEDLEKAFRDTGLIHIVVLSGFNVTIVAEAIMRLFAFVPLLARSLMGGGSIVLFAMLTGASATIVRASVMALLVVLARAVGRQYDITRALFLAGAIMVFHNPFILRFDPSFQLSFIATFGLVYGGPIVERWLHTIPKTFQLREFAVATVATQLFVTPLLVFMTGEVSLVSLPVNLLSLPTIPVSMLIGLFVSITSLVSSTLAFPVAVFGYVSLEYVLTVVEIFSRVPFATVTAPTIPGWAVFVCYMLLGGAVLTFHQRKNISGTVTSEYEKPPGTSV